MATATSILRRVSLLLHHHRHFCSSTAALTGRERKRVLLSLLKKENNPERILEICRTASLTPESHIDRMAFSVAVSKLADANHFEGIRCFIEEFKRRPDLRTERTASYFMVLYGKAGMIRNAIATFESFEEFGIDRSVKSLNSLLFACIIAKKYDEARRVFVDFPKRYRIKPDLDTYNLGIQAFCESASSSLGYSVVSEMERASCKPNETTFGALIEGFYREEKLEDVRKVLKMMEDHNIGLPIFNIRIKCLCKLRRSNEAKALLDSMLSRRMEVTSESYELLIHGFCKEGNLEEAKKLFKSMVGRGCEPDSSCYFTIISFLCQGGDYETALQMCKECMKKNWVPYSTTMKLLVEGLVSVSKVDEARELIKQAKDRFPTNAKLWKETEDSLPK